MLLVACGDSGPSGPTADKACGDEATNACAALEGCNMNYVERVYGAMATCVSRVKANCVLSLTAKGTGATTTTVENCALAYPTASCADLLYGNVAACQPAIGTLAVGASCSYSGQCTTGFCSFGTGLQCGTCAAASSPGDDCSQTSCSHPLACITDSVDMTLTCEPYGGVGASCDHMGHACGFETVCVIASGAQTGTCTQQGTAAGTACDNRAQTAANCTLYKGLFCSGVTKQCTAVTYVGAGTACGGSSPAGVDNVCTGGSTCFKGTNAKATCVANALEGQACDTSVGPACLSPGRCVTGGSGTTAGVCTLPTPAQCM